MNNRVRQIRFRIAALPSARLFAIGLLLLTDVAWAQGTVDRPTAAQTAQTTASGKSATGVPRPEPTPVPAIPAPLPELPPPLAEQALPYSMRYIDRPFTLPSGLHELTLRGFATKPTALGQEFAWRGYLTEVQYRMPLTNDFTLLWNPFPLGVQYQPKRTETSLTGVSWSIGWNYQGNVGARPGFSGYVRRNLNPVTAIEMQLDYFSFIPFEKASSIWSGAFRIGPLFQQSNRFALSPRLSVMVENVRPELLYGPRRAPLSDGEIATSAAQLSFPFSLWANWVFAPGLEVTGEYILLGSGSRSRSYTHVGSLGLTTRW